MSDKPVKVVRGYLVTRDGVRLCRVMALPNDCQLVFHDKNRLRSRSRGSDAVCVSLLDIVRAVAEKD